MQDDHLLNSQEKYPKDSAWMHNFQGTTMRYNEEYYQTGTWWWNSRFQAIVKLVYVRNQCDIEIHTQRGRWSSESVWYADLPTEMHRIKNFDPGMLPDRYQYPERVVQERTEAKSILKWKQQAEREASLQEARTALKTLLKKNH